MSFSVEFYAATKKAAHDALASQHLPDSVREFLRTAIDALELATETRPRVIYVKARGHLCEGPQSYAHSTGVIEVRPVSLSG